jgi:hypothetical protein
VKVTVYYTSTIPSPANHIRREIVPVTYPDVTSMYPTVGVLMRLFGYLDVACRMCGEMLPSRRRVYYDECRVVAKTENLMRLQVSGPTALARLMAEGQDPTHSEEASRKRAASLARRQKEAAQWEQHHGRPNPEEFRMRILPQLRGVPLRKMAKATGLSLWFCSKIRRGLHKPHARHWESLRSLAGAPNCL